MFLKEITLTNFKCHEHLYLSFVCDDKNHPIRKTTFMLGENGTGKSALLKAIALITSGSTALKDILGTPDSWIKNNKSACEISATVVTQQSEERDIKLVITRGQSFSEIILENSDTLKKIDDAIKNSNRNYFIVAYGASRRLNRGEDNFSNSYGFSSPRSQNVKTLFNPDASLVSLSNWAVDLDYQQGEAGVQTIKDTLNQFLVDDVEFASIDRQTKRLMFKTPDGLIALDQLSDGYQNVSAWVGDLMYNITNTFQDYKSPLSARGVLLIDEIDLHLHPKWQRLLHKFLKEKLPNFQVIATTHSPLTAQQAEDGELYALKREQANIELIAFQGSPSKMLLHQLLMSPVFGLPTDESLKVQKAKDEVREITLKTTKLTLSEERKLAMNEELLKEVPVNVRSNSLLSDEDLGLLQAINKQLKTKK